MAPTTSSEALLAKRDYCRQNYNGDVYCYDSPWNDWGRWVALAVIVVVVLFFAFLFSCIRTRRRRNQPPFYGTGWIPTGGPKGPSQQNGGYYANQPYGGPPAPPYSPAPVQSHQQTGTTFNSNDGYYGNQGAGIELQTPQNAHTHQRGGDAVYEPPTGPPPSKK
ncbi:hypothetical protein HYFRA_00010051 [Hymenoscyphus fraxineus]|uniref:Uncharacterized protein n=1 Tax=Hymenoscyphus fraxineus TaxID=746836 RepID=A0A9N9KY32_9HELO|nr:hypothetical protein HYFRA_00010051 [Hymenoscyphus fraxineus]